MSSESLAAVMPRTVRIDIPRKAAAWASPAGEKQQAEETHDTAKEQFLELLTGTAPVGEEALDAYLQSCFPKARGKLHPQEFLLMRCIKQLAPDNLRLGVLYYFGAYELWIICKRKDYKLLEQASEYLIEYESAMKATVNCIWVSEEKLSTLPPPRFMIIL